MALIFWNSLCHLKIFCRVEIVKYYMGEKVRKSVAALACRLGLRHSWVNHNLKFNFKKVYFKNISEFYTIKDIRDIEF